MGRAMTNDLNPGCITTREAADLTGYHTVHIRRLIRDGHIRGRKFGRDWLLLESSLLAYAEKMTRLGSGKHDPTKAWADNPPSL